MRVSQKEEVHTNVRHYRQLHFLRHLRERVPLRRDFPVGAIAEGADHYEINQDVCAQCGSCASNCPIEAIEEQ